MRQEKTQTRLCNSGFPLEASLFAHTIKWSYYLLYIELNLIAAHARRFKIALRGKTYELCQDIDLIEDE